MRVRVLVDRCTARVRVCGFRVRVRVRARARVCVCVRVRVRVRVCVRVCVCVEMTRRVTGLPDLIKLEIIEAPLEPTSAHQSPTGGHFIAADSGQDPP